MLAVPYFEKPFVFGTEASAVALAAVLSQVKEDSKKHAIQYASRTITKAERNYSACERDALAAVFALKKFRMYLPSSIPFVLETDQQALKSAFAKRDIHGRLARWLDFLADYDFEFQYCRSVTNRGPDFLYRILHGEKGYVEEHGYIVYVLISEDDALSLDLEDLCEVSSFLAGKSLGNMNLKEKLHGGLVNWDNKATLRFVSRAILVAKDAGRCFAVHVDVRLYPCQMMRNV